MDMKRKAYILMIFFVTVAIAVVIGFIDLYTPDSIGRKGVIREIITSSIFVIMGACLLILIIGYNLKKKLIKTFPFIMILITLTMGFLFAIGSVFQGIMGLNAGPIEIENGNYELDYRSPYRGLGTGTYYIVVVGEYSITRIRIDKASYDYLSTNTPNVTITYYPYINIADEITYQPDNSAVN